MQRIVYVTRGPRFKCNTSADARAQGPGGRYSIHRAQGQAEVGVMRVLTLVAAAVLVSCETTPTLTAQPVGPLFGSSGSTSSGAGGGAELDAGIGPDGGFTNARACAITVPDAGFALSSPCNAGEFCNAPGCISGFCEPLPLGTLSNARDPQCGCDRVTYWNADIAAAFGASIAFAGECIATVECGGVNQVRCPGQTLCNLRQFSQSECSIGTPVGTCWGLPASCPLTAPTGLFAHSCALNNCSDDCTLIRGGHVWFMDPSCPQ
jgi:hypothetical protein